MCTPEKVFVSSTMLSAYIVVVQLAECHIWDVEVASSSLAYYTNGGLDVMANILPLQGRIKGSSP